MRRLFVMAALALWGVLLNGQEPAFEVASVKVSPPPDTTPIVSADPLPGGRWVATNADIARLIVGAYPEFSMPGRIIGDLSPAGTRFDVNAKAAGNASYADLRLMARRLLRERFGLAFHIEQRPLEAYAMVLLRKDARLGPGLVPALADCTEWASALATGQPAPQLPAISGRPSCGGNARMQGTVMQVRGWGRTMGDLAGTLMSFVRPRIEVVDRTGLAGRFDITLDFVHPQIAENDPDAEPTFVDAVADQLGLKFERRREPVNVLVIDRVQMPTPD